MSNCFIPLDLVVEILSRLPVKSLMRFKCLSKSWCEMISHPDLCKKHMNQSRSNMKLIFEARSSNTNSEVNQKLYDVDFTLLGEISNLKEIKYPPIADSFSETRLPNNVVAGYSNGVVCLRMSCKLEEKEGAFVLWNPSTRKHLILPNCFVQYHDSFLDIHCVDGFGYDERTDDYKVVRLVKFTSTHSTFYRSHIYSLKSNRWRISKDFAYESDIYWRDGNGVFANGALYYLLNDHSILSFILRTEKFKLLKPPKISLYSPFLCEGILDGYHHLILCNRNFEKWIKIGYNWCKRPLKDLSAGTQLLFMKPLIIPNNIEINNLDKLSFEKIKFPVEGEYFHSFLYFESLVPLQHEEQVCKGQKRKQKDYIF